jgi:glycosyltransferase involved in cell wall biosynthesis
MVGVLTAGLVSYRLGGPDGVSVEAAKWAGALARLGWNVRTVAGSGSADVLVSGLGLDDGHGPESAALNAALDGADLVIVENVCSLPLNRLAAHAVASALAGRAAILHHHDLPWQRSRLAGSSYDVPDDPCWTHVTINDLSRSQLAQRGIKAVTIRNAFDTDVALGDRERTRASLGLGPDDRLIVQPTRAIARKNIPVAMDLAEACGAAYWLLGPAEEGYDAMMAGLLEGARQRGLLAFHGTKGTPAADNGVAHAYAAADAVAFPSSWEGFGNPVVESAIHRRPLAIRRYPVAEELAAFGFRWLDADRPSSVQAWFDRPDPALVDHNLGVARREFSLARLDGALDRLLRRVGGRRSD